MESDGSDRSSADIPCGMIRQSGHHQTPFDRELVAKNTEVAGWTQELDYIYIYIEL